MSVYQAVAELEASNGSGALCTIVRSQGATPRHTASKMLVYLDGRITGSVGGGELENRVIAEAVSNAQRLSAVDPCLEGLYASELEGLIEALRNVLTLARSHGVLPPELSFDERVRRERVAAQAETW